MLIVMFVVFALFYLATPILKKMQIKPIFLVIIALLAISTLVAVHYHQDQIKDVTVKVVICFVAFYLSGMMIIKLLFYSALKSSNQTNINPTANTSSNNEPAVKNPKILRAIILAAALITGSITGIEIAKTFKTRTKFLETTCTVLDKKLLKTYHKSSVMYLATFNLQYMVGDKTYTTWASANIAHSYSTGGASIINSYDINEAYPCWYDPSQPNIIVLDRSFDSSTIFISIFTLFLLYCGLTPWKKMQPPTNKNS